MSTLLDKQFVKSYEQSPSGYAFEHTAVVRHEGTVLAFAMDAAKRIYYSVLDFDREDISSPLDINYWDTEPLEVRFPNEFATVGFRLALHQMPLYRKTSDEAVTDGSFVDEKEKDFFRSTTARLTALAPFQVLSDGKHIYMFRQSVAGEDADNVEVDAVPLVNNTMLVDRFVFSAGILKPKREVRFQRSRNKDLPASRKDTLNTEDMEKTAFFEPTYELDLIKNLQDGQFSVLLLPTSLPEVERWQIFAYNNDRIDSFNIERAKDGLFNTRGTRYYTSPEPIYQDDVFERKPGTDPFTGRALIPKISRSGFAEWALAFSAEANASGETPAVTVSALNAAGTQALEAFSFECWLKTDSAAQTGKLLDYGNGASAFSVSEPGDLVIAINGASSGSTGISLGDGVWHHLTVSWENQEGRVAIHLDGIQEYNGKLAAPDASTGEPQTITLGEGLTFGRDFRGLIDEVRLWSRQISDYEIREEMNHRLVGNEPELIGYWRFDEGSGTTVHDQTDNRNDGACTDGADFVSSDTPTVVDEATLDGNAMVFDGSMETYVQEKALAGFPQTELTVECWLKSDDAGKGTMFSYANSESGNAFRLQNQSNLDISIGSVRTGGTGISFRDGKWRHLAVTWKSSDGKIKIYKDGREVASGGTATVARGAEILSGGSLVLGQDQDFIDGVFDPDNAELGFEAEDAFNGSLYEVRVWNKALTKSEIAAGMNQQIASGEPGLVYRWPGTLIMDLSSPWVYSDAPVGDHPGVRRSSFSFVGRELSGGLSAYLYHQQENAGTGYNPDVQTPVKRSARVMLAAATSEPAAVADDDENGARDYIAAVDFGISREGKLALIPDVVELGDPIQRADASGQAASIDELLTQIRDDEQTKLGLIAQNESIAAEVQHYTPAEPPGADEIILSFLDDDDALKVEDIAGDNPTRESNLQGWLDEIDGHITALRGDTETSDETLKFDAAFRIDLNGEDGYYFFRGDQCVFANPDRVAGPVDSIANLWPGLPDTWKTEGIDAAVSHGNNAIYFLKGDSLVKVVPSPVDADEKWRFESPQKIADTWTALPSDWQSEVDSAAYRDQDSIHLFKNDLFLIYDISNDTVQEAKPVDDLLPVSSVWQDIDLHQSTYAVLAQQLNGEAGSTTPFYFFLEYEFVDFAGSNGNAGQLIPILVNNDAESWQDLNLLFGVPTELTGDEEKVEQLQVLKTGLQDLYDVITAIRETTEALFSEVHLPLPFLHVDPTGLTISGALLGFAWTQDAPLLFESVNGRLNLYFRGDDNQFFVAYYDVLTGRATFQAATENSGRIDFIARSAGPDLATAAIAIADGPAPDVCTVGLDLNIALSPKDGVARNLALREVWQGVPRQAVQFADTLNGLNPDFDYAKMHFYQDGDELPVNGASGSLLFVVSSENQQGDIVNGIATSGGEVPASQWFADPPGSAVSFSRADSYVGREGEAEDFAVDGDLTLEAWVSPLDLPANTTVARVVNHRSANSSYAMGLLQVGTAKVFDGSTNDYVAITGLNGFPGEAMTLEFWVRASALTIDRSGTPISYANSDDNHNAFLLTDHNDLNIYVNGQATGATGVSLLDEASVQIRDALIERYGHNPWLLNHIFTILAPYYGRSAWRHIAVTWQSSNGQVKIYKDGELGYEGTVASGETLLDGGALVFGQNQGSMFRGDDSADDGSFNENHALLGEMDEVRIWNVVRTAGDIRATMKQQWTGKKAGLVAYWRFEGDDAINLAAGANHGKLHGNSDLSVSPFPRYNPFASVGNMAVKAESELPMGGWKHLAAVFNQSYALQFDGVDDNLDCGSDRTLNISHDLTIEATIRVADFAEPRGILSKGRIDDGTDEDVPYSLYLNTAGRLVFAFEDKGHRNRLLGGSNLVDTPDGSRVQMTPLGTGTHKIAVTRKKQSKTEIIDYTDPETGQIFSVPKVLEWWDIDFYVDGTRAGYVKYKGNIGSGQQPIEIGRAYDPKTGKVAYFKGDIAEVRVWRRQLQASEIAAEIKGGEDGLVGWWRFEENEGNLAKDSAGTNHGKRLGPAWTKNPDPLGSTLTLFVDGKPVAATAASGVGSAAGVHQIVLGGGFVEPGALSDGFLGWLDEVRIWKMARTEEQIQDNLFGRLVGEREQLVAHYDCDDPEATELLDQSGGGLHLPFHDTEIVLSTAPISKESYKVRDALAGIKNDFHDRTETRPGVQEYGDVQVDLEGNMLGVMKRCYAFLKGGALNLITGFKVGDLSLEWVGQAQYDPQLFGFIEGAPPVPSENLTDDNGDYEGASSVEFVDADKVDDTYAVSVDRGIDASLEFKAQVGLKSTTAAGLGFSTTVEDTQFKVGVKGVFETSYSWLKDASIGTGKTTRQSSKMELQGAWENPGEIAYPETGRRFVPRNLGFALVKSETADIFAMRLKSTGVMVGYKLQPNPDIPADWNIITFPLNPRYLKQGTLDGKIGIEPEANYVTADYSIPDRSFYKPKEAYALKTAIEREQEELRNLYSRHSTAGLSENLPEVARQNMINTFVWTADGGTFNESEETMEVQTESVGGSFQFKGMGGIAAEGSFAISKALIFFELEALVGGHHNVTRTKSRESENSFALNITLDGENDIYQRDAKGNLVMDHTDPDNPTPVKKPGKVDAYRFMSFYLKPDKEHFKDFKNKVVDRIWLEESSDPNAIALAQALAAESGVPWRIMHRVTYISRVLPEVGDPTTTPDSFLKEANIESNYELIRRLQPYVRSKTDTYQEFAEAVREAVVNYLPELTDYQDEVLEFMSLYYQVFDEE